MRSSDKSTQYPGVLLSYHWSSLPAYIPHQGKRRAGMGGSFRQTPGILEAYEQSCYKGSAVPQGP